MKKMKKAKEAVSDVLGTILLLGITISLFSVLTAVVLSYPFDPNPPSVNLIGYIDQNDIIIEHRGGENLDINTKIKIEINNSRSYSTTAGDVLTLSTSNGDNYWNIGELVLINGTVDLTNEILIDASVYIAVVDIASDSIILMGYLQEAS